MSTYKSRIFLTKEAKETQELEFQIEEAAQQWEADITATKRALAKATKQFEAVKSEVPLSSSRVLDAEKAVDGYTKGLARLLALKDELFGTDADEPAATQTTA